VRHVFKWCLGRREDPDGQHHLAAAAASLMFLMERENGKD